MGMWLNAASGLDLANKIFNVDGGPLIVIEEIDSALTYACLFGTMF
jgi:hypothetical protein